MPIDAATALRELGVQIVAGADPGTWRLEGEDGLDLVVTPAPPVERVDARSARAALARPRGPVPLLLVGSTATTSVVTRAKSGELNLLTCDPPRLVSDGVTREVTPTPEAPSPAGRPGRPAWGRWALMRYLVLADGPARQMEIAGALGLSQQAVSLGLHSFGDLVGTSREGAVVADRAALLDRWLQEYPGPGGHEAGWHGLDAPATQARTALAVAWDQDTGALVSGDVAADLLAPWQLPRTARLYVDRPVDLSRHHLVPAPLEEASLILREPRDPTLWLLAEHRRGLLVADPLIVLRDLTRQPGAEEAADRLRESILSKAYQLPRLGPAR